MIEVFAIDYNNEAGLRLGRDFPAHGTRIEWLTKTVHLRVVMPHSALVHHENRTIIVRFSLRDRQDRSFTNVFGAIAR
ncbi:MAG TPA: hypothetical protein VGQ65_16200 [Thermoanaerobaculia bacterium]|jgi:hypothetical protein|nr:hypothetical protein [Thermoanaerobaculia bacterium]